MKCRVFLFILTILLPKLALANECSSAIQTLIWTQEFSPRHEHQQGCTPTCWLMSGLTLAESFGGNKQKFSSAYMAHALILKRAATALRGSSAWVDFGGHPSDTFDLIRAYGVMPDAAWTPKIPFTKWEMEEVIAPKIRSLALEARYDYLYTKAENAAKEANFWKKLNAFLDSYYGLPPEKFAHADQTFTPSAFRDRLTDLGSRDMKTELIVPNPRFLLTVTADNFVVAKGGAEEVEKIAFDTLNIGQPVSLTFLTTAETLQEAHIAGTLIEKVGTNPKDLHSVTLVGYVLGKDNKTIVAWKVQDSWPSANGGIFVLPSDIFRRRMVNVQRLTWK